MANELKVGDVAPDFCLKANTGKDVCLKDLGGKWVVLYFYPKDNTPGCTIEAIDFTKEIGEIEQMGGIVLGVSKDSYESHCRFTDNHDLKVTLLSDLDHKVIESYGSWQPAKFMGKEFLGTTRSTFLIDPKGKIAYIWPKVSVTGHVEDVKRVLKELQYSKKVVLG